MPLILIIKNPLVILYIAFKWLPRFLDEYIFFTKNDIKLILD